MQGMQGSIQLFRETKLVKSCESACMPCIRSRKDSQSGTIFWPKEPS